MSGMLLATLVDNSSAPAGSAANNIARFITLLIVFVLVLAVTFYTTRFVARAQQGRSSTANMEILETLAVANGKYLQIVRIGKTYVVLAIGKDTISRVAEIPEEDYIPFERPQGGNFGEILKKLGNRRET